MNATHPVFERYIPSPTVVPPPTDSMYSFWREVAHDGFVNAPRIYFVGSDDPENWLYAYTIYMDIFGP